VRRGLVAALLVLAVAAPAAAVAELRVETKDWVLTAPDEVATQGELDLMGRAVQLCTDEIVKLLGHRPTVVERFTMQWRPASSSGAGATQTGVFNWYAPGRRITDPAATRLRESLVAERRCFGPHEITHVLSWDSFRIAWASEGFAEYTDRLYQDAFRCCAQPPPASFRCDERGWWRYAEQRPYRDLSPFDRTNDAYNTGACFWWEAQRAAGFPGLRALLASMRARPPVTTGELVVQHANPILGVDLRPYLIRYGFEPHELTAPPAPAGPRLCTRLGTEAADVIVGTAGRDVLCGAGGRDRLAGGHGADVFRAGAGDDVLLARDRVVDAVACGPGRDTVTADRRDRVNRDCERVSRR
jgi:hypothetical protein